MTDPRDDGKPDRAPEPPDDDEYQAWLERQRMERADYEYERWGDR